MAFLKKADSEGMGFDAIASELATRARLLVPLPSPESLAIL
jgi:hypothetical protein